MTKKILLFDGMALVFRSYYALLNQNHEFESNKGAVYGFLSLLFHIFDTENPDEVAFGWDMPGKTFRSESFNDYKAQRTAPPDELKDQFQIIFDLCDLCGFQSFGVSGYEGDDILATLSAQLAEDKENHVMVISGDRDLLQLVSDNISVVLLKQGYTKRDVYTPAFLQEKYGLSADQIIDFKALTGDPSDNIPGAFGIGPKTATGLLQKYKTLENTYKHIDEIGGKVQEKLVLSSDNVFLSQELVKLVQVPGVDGKSSELSFEGWQYEKLIGFCQDHGFIQFAQRLKRRHDQDIQAHEANNIPQLF
jgi:DNA polymerase I